MYVAHCMTCSWQGSSSPPDSVPALSIAMAVAALGFPKADVDICAAALLCCKHYFMALSSLEEILRALGCPPGSEGLVVSYLTWVRYRTRFFEHYNNMISSDLKHLS
jgi:hypothetical protein